MTCAGFTASMIGGTIWNVPSVVLGGVPGINLHIAV